VKVGWPQAWRRILASECRLAGLLYFSPHMARHTYSHAMKMEGLPHEEIAPALGHRDTRMLDRSTGELRGPSSQSSSVDASQCGARGSA
jgi:integrase